MAAVDLNLTIVAHNIRSLKSKTNLHATSLLLENEKPDLLLLSETWVNTAGTVNLHHDYQGLLSPPEKYQGVAIYAKHSVNAIPHRQEAWTPNYVFCKIEDLIIMSVYVNPRDKIELSETILWFA